MAKYDNAGILEFVFGESILEKAQQWIESAGEWYKTDGLFYQLETRIDRELEKHSYSKGFFKSKVSLCEDWMNCVQCLEKIGVYSPEIAFLVSDLSYSGTWLLNKGILLHGKAVVADVINELVKRHGGEMLYLTSILSSDNPYEAARSYGIGYSFPSEVCPYIRKTADSQQIVNDMLVLLDSDFSDEDIQDLVFLRARSTLKIMQEKQIDIDELSSCLGTDRQSMIDNLLHRIDDFSFYYDLLGCVASYIGGNGPFNIQSSNYQDDDIWTEWIKIGYTREEIEEQKSHCGEDELQALTNEDNVETICTNVSFMLDYFSHEDAFYLASKYTGSFTISGDQFRKRVYEIKKKLGDNWDQIIWENCVEDQPSIFEAVGYWREQDWTDALDSI